MNKVLNKLKKITDRDLKNKSYDYLILNIDNKEEVEILMNFIKKSEIKIDIFFLISSKLKKKKLYLQISELKENRKKMINDLKFIHSFWRINFNKDISYKKASKHSVFFDGKNFILNSTYKVEDEYIDSLIQKEIKIWFEDEYKEL